MSQKDINWKIIGAQDVSGDQNQKLRETSHHCHTQHYQQAAIKTSKNTLEFLGRQNHSHVPFVYLRTNPKLTIERILNIDVVILILD